MGHAAVQRQPGSHVGGRQHRAAAHHRAGADHHIAGQHAQRADLGPGLDDAARPDQHRPVQPGRRMHPGRGADHPPGLADPAGRGDGGRVATDPALLGEAPVVGAGHREQRAVVDAMHGHHLRLLRLARRCAEPGRHRGGTGRRVQATQVGRGQAFQQVRVGQHMPLADDQPLARLLGCRVDAGVGAAIGRRQPPLQADAPALAVAQQVAQGRQVLTRHDVDIAHAGLGQPGQQVLQDALVAQRQQGCGPGGRQRQAGVGRLRGQHHGAQRRPVGRHGHGRRQVGHRPAPTHPLRRHARQEGQVADQVALPHAARLLAQAPDPFQADIAHPLRGARNPAADKVEQAADAQGHAHAQQGQVAVDELFLHRHATRHQQAVGTAGAHGGHHGRLAGGAEVAMLQARHPQGGPAAGDLGSHGLGHTGPPAQQVDRAAGARQLLAQLREQVGAVEVLLQRRAQQCAGQLDADAVGQHQRAARQRAAVAAVGRGDVDAGRVDEGHLVRVARGHQRLQPGQRLVHVQVVEADIGHRDARWRGRGPAVQQQHQRAAQQQAQVAAQATRGGVLAVGVVFGAVVHCRALPDGPVVDQPRPQLRHGRGGFTRQARPRADHRHVTGPHVAPQRPVLCTQACGQPAGQAVAELQPRAVEELPVPADQRLRLPAGGHQPGGQHQQRQGQGGQQPVECAGRARGGVGGRGRVEGGGLGLHHGKGPVDEGEGRWHQ